MKILFIIHVSSIRSHIRIRQICDESVTFYFTVLPILLLVFLKVKLEFTNKEKWFIEVNVI